MHLALLLLHSLAARLRARQRTSSATNESQPSPSSLEEKTLLSSVLSSVPCHPLTVTQLWSLVSSLSDLSGLSSLLSSILSTLAGGQNDHPS